MASTKGEVKPADASTGSRAAAYFSPWWGLISAPLFAAVAHWGFTDKAHPEVLAVVSALEALAGVLLGVVAWDAGRPRGRHMQIFATVYTGTMCLWTVAATIFGVFNRPIAGALFLCIVFVAAYSIRRALRGQGGDDEQAGTLAKRIREAGRQVKNVKIDPDTGVVEGRVIANREHEAIDQVAKDLPATIESIEGLPRGSVQVIEDRNDRGAGTLRIVPGHALEESELWRGPSAPGKSIALPIPVGLYVDREPAQLWLPGDDAVGRNASHFKVMGTSGAGKTKGMKIVAADALTRVDFVLWGSCHIKGLQTFGPLIEYMDWAVIDRGADIAGARSRARAMFATLRKLVSFNAEQMGLAGYDQWTPEVYEKLGIPLTMAWVEEAAEVTEDSQSFTRLCQQARSAGVIICWSHQRASHTSIDTDARAQLNTEWCFGVTSSGKSEDAAFGLPDSVLEAGADPAAWGNRKPGMSYLVAPGIDEERWPTPLRTFLTSDKQIAEVLAAHAGRAKLPDAAIKALGEDYARREVYAAGAAALLAPSQYSAQAVAVTDDDEDDDSVLGALDPEDHVNSEEPIEEPDVNMDFGVPAPARRLTTTEARQVVQQHLRALLEAGQTRTQAADIHKMRPDTTRSSEWVRQELLRLCSEPLEGEVALERDDSEDVGVFQITSVVGGVTSSALARA